jgi:hypothetical protein
MGETRPWKDARPDDPAEQRAAELVELAAKVPPRQVDVGTGWDAIIDRAMRTPRGRPLPLSAFAIAALLVVGGLQFVVRQGTVGNFAPRVVASQGAQWHREGDGALILTLGRLEISRPKGQVILHSPHVTVIAVNARFLADTTSAATRIEVYEGEVIVRHEDSGVVVQPGDSRIWPDAPAMPQALVPPSMPPERCADELGIQRRACLWQQIEMPGLVAQAALFELGVFELKEGNDKMAEVAWKKSLERFPEGVLAPEVRLSLLGELHKQKRFTEAAEMAREFEKASPEDPRTPELAKFRAQLEGFAALEQGPSAK